MSIQASFDKEQPAISIVEQNDKIYAFICLNGEWRVDSESGIKYWECDYNQIVTNSEKIDISDLKMYPSKYLNWKELKPKTDSERIDELEQQNSLLTRCILEMSTIIYE